MKFVKLTYAVAIAGLLAFVPALSIAQDKGTTIIAAMNSSVAVPDPIFMSAQGDANFWTHVFERVITIGEQMNPVPQLASSYDVSEDGLEYTFHLRSAVLFHNGKEMTSEDVKASWERYARLSPGKASLAKVVEMSTPDAHTFKVTLGERQPLFIEGIAATTFPMVVIPSEESGKERGEIEPIGTGPYRFVNQVTDDFTEIERFDDYAIDESQPEGFNGFAGKRVANVDRIIFKAIPEAGTRIASLQTGEVTIADNLTVPAANRLVNESSGEFLAQDVMPFSKAGVAMNTTIAPTDNVLVRQAIQAAINAEEIMEVALEGFYRLDPSFVFDYGIYYPSDAVEAYYNQNDIERSKELLAEAGYNGEVITILTNTNYSFMQNIALVMAEQLKAAGMNVEVDVVDWPTNVSALVDGAGHWNLTPNGYGAQPLLGPAAWLPVIKQHSQIKESDAVLNQLAEDLLSAPELDDRRAIWEKIELHAREMAYLMPLGDRGLKVVSTSGLRDYKPFYSMRFWNTHLD